MRASNRNMGHRRFEIAHQGQEHGACTQGFFRLLHLDVHIATSTMICGKNFIPTYSHQVVTILRLPFPLLPFPGDEGFARKAPTTSGYWPTMSSALLFEPSSIYFEQLTDLARHAPLASYRPSLVDSKLLINNVCVGLRYLPI